MLQSWNRRDCGPRQLRPTPTSLIDYSFSVFAVLMHFFGVEAFCSFSAFRSCLQFSATRAVPCGRGRGFDDGSETGACNMARYRAPGSSAPVCALEIAPNHAMISFNGQWMRRHHACLLG